MKNAKLVFAIITFCTIFSVDCDQRCDRNGILLYETLGCTPTHFSENKCPIKYSCEFLGPSSTHCYFKGKAYASREKVNDTLSLEVCEVNCECIIENKKPRFECAVLDCLDTIGPEVKKDCYRTYALDQCCAIGEKCPPFDDILKCTVEGTEYKELQEFWPSNTCKVCLCQKGFKGKYVEPFCKRKTCVDQLREDRYTSVEQRCAPFYEKSEVLCCPSNWICPDDTESIKGEAKSDDVCHFGNKTLNVGQYFDKSNHTNYIGKQFENVRCECVIPPLVKCENV